MICQECGGHTCINCDTIWHPEATCESMAKCREEEAKVIEAARAAEESAATQYLEGNSKLCPRCQVRGTKISGCDHIRCQTPSS